MHQVSFLPYFPTPERLPEGADIKINRVHLFNFWNYKDRYIPDLAIRAKMEKLFSMYVDDNLESCKSVTVAVIDGNYDFTQAGDLQIIDLQRYALALLFCCIAQNNPRMGWVSEHFTLIHQNFVLSEDFVGYQVGSYKRYIEYGIELERKRFIKSDYIIDAERFIYDEELFQAFANMIDARSKDEGHIFSALEWVRSAHINPTNFRAEIRPVMLMTAFETIFKLSQNQKEEDFANQLEELLGVDKFLVLNEDDNTWHCGLTLVAKNNSRGKSKKNTMYGWWARDFYSLRSKIVHEGLITDKDWKYLNGISHFEIALKMLSFCLYRLMENRNYLVYENSAASTLLNDPSFFTIRRLRRIEEHISNI